MSKSQHRWTPGPHHHADDQESAAVGVRRDGSGLSLNWKAVGLGVIAVYLGSKWMLGIENASDAHTTQLTELHQFCKDLDVKVNALLIDNGDNPDKVLAAAKAKK